MVKRPKSPVVEEDTRYFTVYQPYPLNANWLLDEDQKLCAKWVAECIGPDHLISIYHKPKARGMILLEISRLFTEHGSLLGEHRWKEILKNPDSLEENSVTKVFHSFYAKGRDAQKDGWKEIPVTRQWFLGWAPGKGSIVKPYPETHWCEVPPEDLTNKKLCRPLPAEKKAPPPKVEPRPVVGSSQWVDTTLSDLRSSVPAKIAWKKPDPPKLPDPLPKRPDPPSLPIDQGTDRPPQLSGKWGKPVPLKQFTTTEKKSSGPSGWATIKSPVVSGKSPLAEPPSSGPVNAWAKPLKIPHGERRPSTRDNNTPTSSNFNSPWGFESSLPSASPAVESRVLPAEPSSPKKDKKKNRTTDRPEKEGNREGGSHAKSNNGRNRYEERTANDGHKDIDSGPPGLQHPSTTKRQEKPPRKEATPDWSGHVRNDDIWAMPVEKEMSEPSPDYVTKWLDENIKGIRSEPTGKSKDLPPTKPAERETSSRGGRDRDRDRGRNRDEGRNESRNRGENRRPDESRDRGGHGERGKKTESHNHPRSSSRQKFNWADEPYEIEVKNSRDTDWSADTRDSGWKKPTTDHSSSNKRKTETQYDKHGKLTYQNDSRKRANLSTGGSDNSKGERNDRANGRGEGRGRGESRGRGRNHDSERGRGKGKGSGRSGTIDWAENTRTTQNETKPNKDDKMEFGWPEEPVVNWMTNPPQLPPTPEHKDVEMAEVHDDMVNDEDKGKGKQKEEQEVHTTAPMEDLLWGGATDDDDSWAPPAPSAAQIHAEWGGGSTSAPQAEAEWGGGGSSAAQAKLDWAGAAPSTAQAEAEWGGGVPSAAQAELEWGVPAKSMNELAAEWGVSPEDIKPVDNASTSWDTPVEWINVWNRYRKDAELVCPTHGTTCKKGICRDMDRLVREQAREKREKERGNKPGKKKFGGGLGPKKKKDDSETKASTSGWNPNFSEDAQAQPKTKRKTRRGKRKDKNPMILGQMRGFDDDSPTSGPGGDDENDSEEEKGEEREDKGGEKLRKEGLEKKESSDDGNHYAIYADIKNEWTGEDDWD